MKFFPKNRFLIRLLSSSLSSAFVLAPTYAMDPPPESLKTRIQKQPLSAEDQKILSSTYSFSLAELESTVKNYYKKNFDEGFEALCAYIREPESTIDSTTSLLQEIFKEFPDAIPHCIRESPVTLENWEKNGGIKDVPKIFFSPLNALRLNRQNGIVPKLDLQTMKLLATLNSSAIQQKSYYLNEIDRKYYKTEEIWYYIVSAKSEDEEAFIYLLGRIDGKLNGKKEHHLYYNLLIPLLIAKDPEAEELFKKVYSKSEEAVKCIEKHIKKLEENKKDQQQLECLKKLVTDFEINKKENERLQAGNQTYENAMRMWNTNPRNAVSVLSDGERFGYINIQKKLEELRSSKDYKNTKNKSQKTHGAILKELDLKRAKALYALFTKTFVDASCFKDGQLSKDAMDVAASYLFYAIRLGDKNAKGYEEKIKESKGYKNTDSQIIPLTDPFDMLGAAYWRHEKTHNSAFLEVSRKKRTQEETLPTQNILTSIEKQLPVTSDMKKKNSQEARKKKKKSKQSPSKQEKKMQTDIQTIQQREETPLLETMDSIPVSQTKSSTSIVIVPGGPFGKPTTDISLPESNEQELQEKREEVALTTEVLTVAEIFRPKEVLEALPEKKKSRVKKTLEVSKKEKKPLVRTSSKKDLGSFSSHSEESLPEDRISFKRDKIPLQRTISLNIINPAIMLRETTPPLERRKSSSHIESSHHSIGMATPSKKEKSKKPLQETIKQYLKRRDSEKRLQSFEVQKESEKLPPVMKEAASQVDTSYRKLTRSLSKSDLRRKSGVQLSEKIITDTLDDLQKRGIVNWNRKNNTISATKNDDPNAHITFHTHSNSDKKWFEKPESVTDFLNFISLCDPGMAQTINKIGKKEPK